MEGLKELEFMIMELIIKEKWNLIMGNLIEIIFLKIMRHLILIIVIRVLLNK